MSKSACEVCGRCLGSICKVYEGGLKNYLKNDDDSKDEQVGTELGQAQLKLGLDCTVIFCRFGFSSFGLIELVFIMVL